MPDALPANRRYSELANTKNKPEHMKLDATNEIRNNYNNDSATNQPFINNNGLFADELSVNTFNFPKNFPLNTNCNIKNETITRSINNRDNSRGHFREKLAKTFLEANLNLSQGSKVLSTLQTHRCLSYLPKDCRTLYNTPRVFKGRVCKVAPGEYLHIGVAKKLIKILKKYPMSLLPLKLLVDFN